MRNHKYSSNPNFSANPKCSVNEYPEKLIRVSEAIGCLRKAYYKRMFGEPPTVTCFSLWGHIAENEIKRHILPRWRGWFENVTVQKGILIGHPDFVDYLNQRVIELKFRWRRNPKIRDLAQANAYACMLGFKKFTIRVSWLNYEQFQLEFSDLTFPTRYKRFQVVEVKAENLLHALESRNVELIRSYPQWDWECIYCPYSFCDKRNSRK